MRPTSLILCLLLWFAGAAAAGTPGEVGIGEPLRDVAMRGLNVPAKRLAEWRGTPLLINVWASWCGPCRQEMASLERLSKVAPRHGFRVIGISTDDYPERAQAFIKQQDIRFDNYIDSRLVLENMLGANRIPLTVLVDASGKVVAKHYGAAAWDGGEALAAIRRELGLKPR